MLRTDMNVLQRQQCMRRTYLTIELSIRTRHASRMHIRRPSSRGEEEPGRSDLEIGKTSWISDDEASHAWIESIELDDVWHSPQIGRPTIAFPVSSAVALSFSPGKDKLSLSHASLPFSHQPAIPLPTSRQETRALEAPSVTHLSLSHSSKSPLVDSVNSNNTSIASILLLQRAAC